MSYCLSQRPHGLWLGSAAARLLGLRLRIPLGHGYLAVVSVVFCQGLCVGLTTPPEEFYRVYSECDCSASIMRRSWPTRGCRATEKEKPSRTLLPNRFRSLSKSVATQCLWFFYQMRRSVTTQPHCQVERLQSRGKFERTATYFHNVRRSINLSSHVILGNFVYTGLNCIYDLA